MVKASAHKAKFLPAGISGRFERGTRLKVVDSMKLPRVSFEMSTFTELSVKKIPDNLAPKGHVCAFLQHNYLSRWQCKLNTS